MKKSGNGSRSVISMGTGTRIDAFFFTNTIIYAQATWNLNRKLINCHFNAQSLNSMGRNQQCTNLNNPKDTSKIFKWRTFVEQKTYIKTSVLMTMPIQQGSTSCFFYFLILLWPQNLQILTNWQQSLSLKLHIYKHSNIKCQNGQLTDM